MKRVKVAELTPGMVTAEDVYNYNDQLVLPKGLSLTEQSIERLETFSIMSIRIDDGKAVEMAPEKPDTQPVVPFDQTPYSERVKASTEFKEFKQKYEDTIGDFKSNMNDIVQKGAAIDTDAVLHNTLSMLNTSNGHINIFDMLQNMRQYDDLTYAHCMNVALICNVFAGWLHMDPEEAELVTLCGVFHDIGKLSIPDEIVKKPGKLTDEEFKLIRTHTVEGFRILQNQNINEHIKNTALMHHERCDGSGYPLGFVSYQIDKYAKMVAIADVYDAMTASRVYRGPLCPFKVIEIFEQEGLQCYDAEYILTFLENVVQTYMGNTVRLSDGREGKVIFINKNLLSKPMLEGTNGQFIDLSKEKGVSIEMIL
jgi:putative nucleotidyltransferase with HDIG domain